MGAMGNLRRFLLDGYCYHVVTTTRGRRPTLRSSRNAAIATETIQFVRARAFVLAFAEMPDHFHLLLAPRNNEFLAKIVQGLKGYSAWAINGSRRDGSRVSYYDRVIRDERQLWERLNTSIKILSKREWFRRERSIRSLQRFREW